ncbi:hypothetical protein MMC29_008297 [Sticta canariensis]|nr:hypothetical protein [Sticta canariensis]
MSAGLPSDEVAEDYKNSLEDLTMNSRYEISNLTVIAKENTEHGMAISRVLENHIRNTPPDRKLPALYVLDSIVKNVGTPYTLFLGRNLYHTFMDAYSLVNTPVRKKLDEMLKTWKEPVPGSLDTRPVFPVETTRPIENALIKALTHAVQQQQQQARTQQDLMNRLRPTATPPVPGPGPWRNTPTPPHTNSRYPPPPYTQSSAANGNLQDKTRPPFQPYPQYPPAQPTPPSFQRTFQQPTGFQPPPTENLDSLHKDIADLIAAAQKEFAANLWDPTIQAQLKALLELQTILRTHQLPPDQIQQVRDQVAQLSASRRQAANTPTPAPVPPTPVAPPSVSQLQPDLQALMSSNALAQLLASAKKPQPQQPPPTPPVPQIPPQPTQLPSSQPSINHTSTPAGGENSLVASLRAAGLLPPSSSTPLNGISQPPQPAFPYSQPPTTMHTPPTLPVNLARPAALETRNDVQLSSASLKMYVSSQPFLFTKANTLKPSFSPNLDLVRSTSEPMFNVWSTFLLNGRGEGEESSALGLAFPNQPATCRFCQTRAKSQLEWIKYRDIGDEGIERSNGIETAKALAAATAAKNDPKNKYIPVPDDSTLASTPCPICQEKFETSWNEDAQDFVWMDAIKIGARVYHASCHAEVKKEGGNTPLRTLTPESVLGKRKSGLNDINTLRSKMPKEIRA